MNFQTIKSNQVEAVLANIPKSAIFTVEFVKKDKTVRTLNCRTGVTSYLNPNPSRPRPAMPSNLVTVFDMQSKEYRQFNKETTRKIVAEGTTFIVEG
jgi:hypothetical protein